MRRKSTHCRPVVKATKARHIHILHVDSVIAICEGAPQTAMFALATSVGAARSSGASYARRISYLVGPDGRVIKAYGSVNPGTHATEVLADLGAPQG